MNIASARIKPDWGHSCKALARRVFACWVFPALSSIRILSVHNCGFLGFFNRPWSRIVRALPMTSALASRRDAKSHRGIDLGQVFAPWLYASLAPTNLPMSSNICPFIIHNLSILGYNSNPWLTRSRAFKLSPSSRSKTTLFFQTRSVPASCLARSRSTRAASDSPFSASTLTAANHISSLFGFLANALSRTFRAPGTSPDNHFSLAYMSQRTSACGHVSTAFSNKSFRVSLLPCAFSNSAALRQIPFFWGKVRNAYA